MKIAEVAVLVLFFAVVFTHCKTHGVTFRRQPSNQTVLMGDSGTLECYVKLKQPHRKISIIWSKDGFINDVATMKKARIDPHTEGLGIVNFDSFSVEDDGEYNCQVMLGKSESAYINVLVPPKLTIVGASGGNILIAPGSNSQITCTAEDGKPPAEIRWMFKGEDVTNQSQSTISQGSDPKLWTTTSVLELEINSENDRDHILCYTIEQSIMTSVQTSALVDLMYPPTAVKIKEVSAEHDLVAGEEMTFTCEVTGGNPTPNITWEIGGKEVKGEKEVISSHGGIITNKLVRIMQSTDREITCVAGNKVQERITDVFQRDVLYPPSTTELEPKNNTAVMEGKSWRLKCLVKGGNPQPTVRWLRKIGDGGRLPIEKGDDIRIDITDYDSARSYLTIVETKPEDNDVEFSCEVKISRTGYIKRLQRSPIVKYAPVSINVLAYDKDKQIPNEENLFATTAGNSIYLLCTVQGGYPAPNFLWSRNDVTLTEGNILDWESSVLGSNSDVAKLCDEKKRNYCKILKIDQIVARDNNARYKCEIDHEIRTKLFKATRLKVYFPPSKLNLAFPGKIVAGKRSTFKCTSSPSLPKSTISWYVDDEEITTHISNKYVKVNENDGYNTTSIFKFTPTSSHNNKNISCRARTSVNGESVVMNTEKTQIGTLNVEFKPIFRTDRFSAQVTALEGHDISVPIVVDANPRVSKYRWTEITKYNTEKPIRSGLSWNVTDGRLYMTSLTPHDNRIYQVRAENSHGSTAYNISVNVKYEAHINQVTPKTVKLKESDAVVLKCVVQANPIDKLEIVWKRANGEILKKTKNSTENSFKIENVRVSDEGNFTCTAFNQIGQPHTETATLEVERKPQFDLTQTPKKFAITAYPGQRYGIPCVASGRPQVNITWQDGHGRPIENKHDKYSIETKEISETSFKSLLFIDESKTRELLKTEDDNSRVFVCIASNLQGEARYSISVVEIGPPDCPENVQMGNASATTLSVSWKPEFNGGLKQNIWLKISPPPLNGTLGSDWKKMNATSCTNKKFVIKGLQPGTDYTVTIKSNNTRGDSKIKLISASTTENYAIRTAVSPPGFGDFSSLIWIVSIVAGVLIIVGTVCFVFFCRKGKSMREEDEKIENVRMHSFPIIHPSFDSDTKCEEDNGNEEIRSKRQPRVESPAQTSTGNWKKTPAASGIGNFPEMRRTLSAHSFAQLPASAAPSAECSEMMPTRCEDLNAWERNRNVCDYLNSVRGFNTMRSYKSPALDGFYPKHQHLEQAFNYSMAPPSGNGGSSQQPTMCVVDDGTNHAAIRQPLSRQQSDGGHHSAASAGYVTTHDRIAPLVTQYRESKRCSFGHGGTQAARTTPNDDVMYDPAMVSPNDNGLYVIGASNNNYRDNNQDDVIVEAPLAPPPAVLIPRGWNQTRSSGGAGGHRMSCTEGSSWQQPPQEHRWSMTHRSTTSGGSSEYSSQDFRSHSVTSNSTASSTRALLSNVRGVKRDGPSPPLRFRDRPRAARTDEDELETRREFFLRCVNNDLAEEEEEEDSSSGLDFLV